MKSTRTAGASAPRERRAFSAEFKAEAVRLAAERRAAGGTLSQVGRELDVRPDQLRAWAKRQGLMPEGAAAFPGETPDQEIRRLRREVAVLRQEQAFAKKVAVYFAKESR
jgi:transposase